MRSLNIPLLASIALGLLIAGIYGLTLHRISDRQRDQLKDVEPPMAGLMLSERVSGDISLVKFAGLIGGLTGKGDSIMRIYPKKDSVQFRKPDSWTVQKFRRVFFNGRIKDNWEDLYKNMPVRSLPDGGFVARIDTMDSRVFIYMPYEILYSAVRYAGRANGIVNSAGKVSPGTIPNPITMQQVDAEEIIASGKKGLIETEGIVWEHVSSLISKAELKNSSSVTQLCYLWKHAKDNWVYINDPATKTHEDTWRSASQTIGTYYFDDTHKYSGDCDDFAILVASFARQVGLESRFIGAYSAGGGHAFAEFFVPDAEWSQTLTEIRQFYHFNGNINYTTGDKGNWINLDWWADHIGGPYYPGVRKVFDL